MKLGLSSARLAVIIMAEGRALRCYPVLGSHYWDWCFWPPSRLEQASNRVSPGSNSATEVSSGILLICVLMLMLLPIYVYSLTLNNLRLFSIFYLRAHAPNWSYSTKQGKWLLTQKWLPCAFLSCLYMFYFFLNYFYSSTSVCIFCCV